MKKNLKIGIAIGIGLLFVGAVYYIPTQYAVDAQVNIDEQIRVNLSLQGDLLTSINYYRGLKDDCFNQLTLKQSEKSINKEEVYCDEFDEILDTNDIQLKQLYADMKELITYEYMTVGLK